MQALKQTNNDVPGGESLPPLFNTGYQQFLELAREIIRRRQQAESAGATRDSRTGN